MKKIKILKIHGERGEATEDLLAEEVALRLFIEHRAVVTLLCTPENLEDLLFGFLFTSDLIRNTEDVKKITIDRKSWSAHIEIHHGFDESQAPSYNTVIGSGCGNLLTFASVRSSSSSFQVESAGPLLSTLQIEKLMESLKGRAIIHKETGGVHSAALANPDEILVFREDIGRHNAVDKVVGNYLLSDKNFSDTILITSGRITSEILSKAEKCGISVIISRSAPTDKSVLKARETGMTLIGFARRNRLNIYSGERRIIQSPLRAK
ncbi:MAG: formate dehydrogenase accessory sulfurtransferase FdhD [Spirochaetes bacterium]|nr:MAG: formate dehydrogenase accessory sulfurtransferase FdhD [Spirochaetota bacterium]